MQNEEDRRKGLLSNVHAASIHKYKARGGRFDSSTELISKSILLPRKLEKFYFKSCKTILREKIYKQQTISNNRCPLPAFEGDVCCLLEVT